jgi:hypothetical protein
MMCRRYTELHGPPRSLIRHQTDASAPRQKAHRCVFGISQEARRVLETPQGGCLCNETRRPRPKMGGGGWGWHDISTRSFPTCYFSARSPERHPLGCIWC